MHATLASINFTRQQYRQLRDAGINADSIDFSKFEKSPHAKGSIWAGRLKGQHGAVVVMALTEHSAIAGRSMIVPAPPPTIGVVSAPT